jgi:hypothetical protein
MIPPSSVQHYEFFKNKRIIIKFIQFGELLILCEMYEVFEDFLFNLSNEKGYLDKEIPPLNAHLYLYFVR